MNDLLVEQISYSLLSRWFVGLAIYLDHAQTDNRHGLVVNVRSS